MAGAVVFEMAGTSVFEMPGEVVFGALFKPVGARGTGTCKFGVRRGNTCGGGPCAIDVREAGPCEVGVRRSNTCGGGPCEVMTRTLCGGIKGRALGTGCCKAVFPKTDAEPMV
jgi:hypothetical protein